MMKVKRAILFSIVILGEFLFFPKIYSQEVPALDKMFPNAVIAREHYDLSLIHI